MLSPSFKETHELKVHQLVVQIEGWKQVSPVSVDKVGAFFRQVMPADDMKVRITIHYSGNIWYFPLVVNRFTNALPTLYPQKPLP